MFEGCANPLFVKWVEELRDEAVEKNAKSQYAYSKVPEWLEPRMQFMRMHTDTWSCYDIVLSIIMLLSSKQ